MQNAFAIILTALVCSFHALGGVGSLVSVSLRNNSVWKTEKADKTFKIFQFLHWALLYAILNVKIIENLRMEGDPCGCQ